MKLTVQQVEILLIVHKMIAKSATKPLERTTLQCSTARTYFASIVP